MTKEQRRQAIDFSKIRGTGMPVPSGHIGLGARTHILNLYFEVNVPVPVVFWRNKNRLVGAWRGKTAPTSTWRGKSAPSSSWRGKTSPQDGSTQEI